MPQEYIDMRETIPSGASSVKVTIPIRIIKEIWKKTVVRASEFKGTPTDDVTSLTVKKFPVCFIRSDGKVILELPENVMKSRDYPEEIKNKVREAWLAPRRAQLAKEIDDLYVKFALGEISESELDAQLKKTFKENVEPYKTSFSKRELNFIVTGELEQLLVSLSIDYEHELEENFLELLKDVKAFKDELHQIKDILKNLDENFSAGRVTAKHYETLKERYLGKLTLAEDRLSRLKKLVDDP